MSKLTRNAMQLVGFLHFESVEKTTIDHIVKKSPPIEVFNSKVSIETYGEYKAQNGGEKYKLRKFTLADGRVYYEKVQDEILWGSADKKSRDYVKHSVVYMALQDECGEWIENTRWTKVGGRGYFGMEVEDLT